MIRPITVNDSAALIALAVAAGMFPANETATLDKMLADYFGGNRDMGHICVFDDEGGPRGVAYCAPEPATDRTWNLLMLAVHPDAQGQGHGAALVSYVENILRANGQRLLLIETSGLPSYARTRAFYVKCGYMEEARVRDYYQAGEDMILFRKVLSEN